MEDQDKDSGLSSNGDFLDFNEQEDPAGFFHHFKIASNIASSLQSRYLGQEGKLNNLKKELVRTKKKNSLLIQLRRKLKEELSVLEGKLDKSEADKRELENEMQELELKIVKQEDQSLINLNEIMSQMQENYSYKLGRVEGEREELRVELEQEKLHRLNWKQKANSSFMELEQFKNRIQNVLGFNFKTNDEIEPVEMTPTATIRWTQRKPKLDQLLRCSYLNCGESFERKTELVAHVGVHIRMSLEETGEGTAPTPKRYLGICPHCGRRIGDKTTFEEHTNGHEGIKPYKCPKCPYKTNIRANLFTHKKNKRGCNGGGGGN